MRAEWLRRRKGREKERGVRFRPWCFRCVRWRFWRSGMATRLGRRRGWRSWRGMLAGWWGLGSLRGSTVSVEWRWVRCLGREGWE